MCAIALTLPGDVLSAVKTDQAIFDKIRHIFSTPGRRLLLINLPQIPGEYFNPYLAKNKRYFAYPPYGPAVLCTHLKRRGYIPYILDLNLEVLSAVNKGEVSEGILAWSICKDRLEKIINEFQPGCVGISCMFTMTHQMMIETAKFIKEIRPNLPIVAGGVHTTNAPEMVLRESGGHIDFISTYESETSFCDLLDFANGDSKEASLFQLVTMIDGQVCRLGRSEPPAGEPLDIIPDYLNLPVDAYSSLGEVGAYRFLWKKETKASTVLSNRGCRARCTFCSVRNFNGVSVRARSIASVVEEIERLKETYGINHIMWLDDDLFFDQKRTIQLFNEIVRRNLNITWDASNGVIASASTPEIIHSAAESGAIGMHVGIESGNSEILRSVRKPSGLKHFLQLGKLFKQHPQIFTKGFLIIGFPNETLRQMLDTVSLAIEMGLDWYTVSILTPLPSTDIYNTMVAMGLIEKGFLDTQKTNYGSSQTGKQFHREEQERFNAKDFLDYFKKNLDMVPTREQIDDIWFLMDYKINYERILNEDEPLRMQKLKAFLKDVCDRMTKDNPLGNLFLGIVEGKTGNAAEAEGRHSIVKEFVAGSQYWQKRFQALGLDMAMSSVQKFDGHHLPQLFL